jgi:2-polyprenyl-6-methoxyphenol hydroxylase-like FAD-dependent oxidoreductase
MKEVAEGVELKFKNGTTAIGTTVVGAEGANSLVRMHLLRGKGEAEAMPLVHSQAVFTYGDAEKARFAASAHPSFCIAVHPKGFKFVVISDVPDPDKPETWLFQLVNSWKGERDMTLDNAGRLAQVKVFSEDWAEPFRSSTLWIPDDTPITYDRLGYWITKPWDSRSGKITLAGDSAHPMSPRKKP